MKTIQLTRGKVAIVDDEDFERVSQFKWHLAKRGSREYAIRNTEIDGRRKKQYLHRFIIGDIGSLQVDHINGNGLDNTKINLRAASKAQNMRNRGKQSNNTSGLKGVTRCIREGKWMAQITTDGRYKFLGYFDDPKAASAAYKSASVVQHGEFRKMEAA